MELEGIREKKLALEHSILSHIAVECRDFEVETGVAPQGISVSFSRTEKITKNGVVGIYFLQMVEVDLGSL